MVYYLMNVNHLWTLGSNLQIFKEASKWNKRGKTYTENTKNTIFSHRPPNLKCYDHFHVVKSMIIKFSSL